MTIDAQRVVADVLRKHHPVFDEGGHINGTVPGGGCWDCFCYGIFNTTLEKVLDHQAGAVVAALGGLTRETLLLNEYAAANGAEPERQSRWVGGWMPKEAE